MDIVRFINRCKDFMQIKSITVNFLSVDKGFVSQEGF